MPELTLVCAWCARTIREGDPSRRPTHGMCEPCSTAAFAELELEPLQPASTHASEIETARTAA